MFLIILKRKQLLKSILDLHEIRQVLLLPDMLFVCKKDQGDWSLLSPQIMAELVEYDFGTFQNFDFSKQDIKAQTEALIEARVRPFLMRDGGNIEVLSLDNGCLKVRLKGKCHGCIHAAQTMQNAVENVIKKYIPSVISVHKED